MGRGRAARSRKPDSKSRRHRQPHDPRAPGQLERHGTPDPGRSDAVNSRIHGVRQRTDASGSGPMRPAGGARTSPPLRSRLTGGVLRPRRARSESGRHTGRDAPGETLHSRNWGFEIRAAPVTGRGVRGCRRGEARPGCDAPRPCAGRCRRPRCEASRWP